MAFCSPHLVDDSDQNMVIFHGHHNYVVSIAKLCKENCIFTDVTIECDDGKIAAHRLVLGAVSPYLSQVLSSLPSGLPHVSLLVPDVRKELMQQLIDFIYTGVMKLSQLNTTELQKLVTLLQIDPQNVGIDAVDEKRSERLANSKAVQNLGVKIRRKSESSPRSNNVLLQAPVASEASTSSGRNGRSVSPIKIKPSPSTSSINKPTMPVSSTKAATNGTKSQSMAPKSPPVIGKSGQGGLKIVLKQNYQKEHNSDYGLETGEYMSVLRPSDNHASNVIPQVSKTRPSKRTAGTAEIQAVSPGGSKEARMEMGTPRGRGRGGLRTRGRARGRPSSGRGRGGSRHTGDTGGYHDMENVETWVCAICEKYDPVFPSTMNPEDHPTTEWIGCDCNRWFHKFCTKLKTVDDNFACKIVNKVCLP